MRERVKNVGIAVTLICAWLGHAFADENVVVQVNGAQITELDVREAVNRKIPFMSFHQNISEEAMKKARADAIEDLIEDELLYQAYRKSVKVGKDRVKQELEESRKRYQSEDEFQAALRKAGWTEEQLKSKIERHLTIQEIRKQKITEKARVNEDTLREYYQKNKESYREPEKMKLREIFIAVPATATSQEKKEKRKKAEDVLKRAKAGEDFGILAWNNSEDPYRYKSGDIGYVHGGRLTEDVEKVLQKVPAGGMTDLVETIYGYYIFLVEERVPSVQLDFDQVKDKLRKEMEEQRAKEIEETLIQKLKSTAEIKRYDTQ